MIEVPLAGYAPTVSTIEKFMFFYSPFLTSVEEAFESRRFILDSCFLFIFSYVSYASCASLLLIYLYFGHLYDSKKNAFVL